MARNKPEFPPLFPPGRHHMTEAELRETCVDAFPGSPTRADIFAALERLFAHLLSNGVRCEIWIDGSFITEKPDPEDADITVVIDLDVYDAMDAAFRNDLQARLVDHNFERLLHNFLEVRFPRGDHRRKLWEEARNQWAEFWAVGEKSRFVRGLPVIRLGESDVGRRLLRK